MTQRESRVPPRPPGPLLGSRHGRLQPIFERERLTAQAAAQRKKRHRMRLQNYNLSLPLQERAALRVGSGATSEGKFRARVVNYQPKTYKAKPRKENEST
ncbi:hypothetical protein ACLKA6_003192 [Drosophila palustris]